MKTDTLKKSLLDYAIKGKLTARFRRENNGLNAFDEISTYNDNIKEKRKDLEKELKKCEKELKLEKDKDKKALFKSQIQSLKKEIAKCKEITPLNLSEAPFEIPNSWAWVKLGDICEIRLGKTPPRDAKIYWNSNDYQWVSIADMGESKILTQTKEHISQAGREKCFGDFIFKKGTLLLSFKLTIGKVAFLGFDGFHNEGIASVLPLLHAENEQIFKEFLFHFLPPLTQLCESTGAIKGETLNKQKLNNLSIPLPPLKEQQEIVKKLDLLVTLANDFAITKENLKRIEKRIEKSLLKLALEGSLSKLYRRSSPTLSAFDEINTYNEAIKEKRKDLEKKLKICEKEFKLEKDKDKKAFFKSQIQMLKKELTKCKEITPLNFSEAPFTIPNSWAWVKLGDICEMKKGPFGSAITKDMFIPNGSNAVKIYEQKNAIQKSETLGEYYISLEHFEKLKQFEVFENDIIVSCAGTIGEIFRIPKNAPKGIINQALMKIKLVNEEWIPYFMIFFDFLIKQKSQENSKGSAIKNIPPLDILKNFTIPLPPLKEQEHIAQTLDTLFTLKKGLRVD
ncbi:restriction endonuclease subunit S [Campylobacter upsaliensis]|nr:restriction endonuclease subunit S [Campylobacter upsaliensis]